MYCSITKHAECKNKTKSDKHCEGENIINLLIAIANTKFKIKDTLQASKINAKHNFQISERILHVITWANFCCSTKLRKLHLFLTKVVV